MAQDKGGGSKGGTSVVPTVGGAGKVSVESLVQRYLTIAGSEANARSLITGLRDGTEITLNGIIQEQVQVPVQTQVTETVMVPVRVPAPPPAPPGSFITVLQPQTVTRTVTTYRTETITRSVTVVFTPPTGSMGLGNVDIALALTEAVLTQQSIAAPNPSQLQTALMDTNRGILQMRAKKMGWAEIAQALGFEVK
ncbi:MAG TPA: hypothetical protein VFO57_04600 [Burkholderiales bacterium]|nr:hypothetical protein [Burkholderiales bacterium]